jgi:quinol monooxygenase YgiN
VVWVARDRRRETRSERFGRVHPSILSNSASGILWNAETSIITVTMSFSVIIQLQATPEHTDALGALLSSGIEPTRQEQGNRRYELFRDLDDPTKFVVIEEWDAEAQWHAHLQAPHITDVLSKAGPLMAAPFTAQRLESAER